MWYTHDTLEELKTHMAYRFWLDIRKMFPKKEIGKKEVYYSLPMEVEKGGVYLTNWLSFVYVENEEKLAVLYNKVGTLKFDYRLKTKGENIVLSRREGSPQQFTLIGKVGELDEDGNLTLANTDKVFFDLFDKGIYSGKVIVPSVQEIPQPMTIDEIKKDLDFNSDSEYPNSKELKDEETRKFFMDRIIKLKEQKKGVRFISDKLGIYEKDVRKLLKEYQEEENLENDKKQELMQMIVKLKQQKKGIKFIADKLDVKVELAQKLWDKSQEKELEV